MWLQSLAYPEKVGIWGGAVNGITLGTANACFLFMYALVSMPLLACSIIKCKLWLLFLTA